MTRFSLVACLLFALSAGANAERYSTEDESRFRSERYEKAAPGMLPPQSYLAQAKAVLHKRYTQFQPSAYQAPSVTRRFYRDAPPADRDIVCVKFVYKELIKTPVSAYKQLPNPEWMVRPALLVLMRPNGSKAYVNEVYYQVW